MALPIIAAVALGAAVYHEAKKSHYKSLEHKRKLPQLDSDNAVKNRHQIVMLQILRLRLNLGV